MIKRYYLLSVLACSCISFLASCSAPHSNNAKPLISAPFSVAPGKTDSWHGEITTGKNQIYLKGRLQPSSSAQLVFTQVKPNQPYTPVLISIDISDENCTSGHEIRLNYMEEPSRYRSLYFDRPIPWNSDFELSLSWDSHNKIHLVLNQQVQSFVISENVKYLNIEAEQQAVLIHTFDTTQAPH